MVVVNRRCFIACVSVSRRRKMNRSMLETPASFANSLARLMRGSFGPLPMLLCSGLPLVHAPITSGSVRCSLLRVLRPRGIQDTLQVNSHPCNRDRKTEGGREVLLLHF